MPDQLTATSLALSDAFPVLLGPVRIEYRFTTTELLVRVFPDEWTVDTFEEKLTAGEQDLALRYWTAYWQAGGDATGRLAAWRDLTSHVGPGRAGYVARTRRPRNPGEEPHRTSGGQVVLVVAETDPLPAADRAAGGTYWRAVYRAGRAAAALRAADTALDTAVGATRAARIRSRRPAGLDREPAAGTRQAADVLVAFLDLPAPAAGDTRPATWTAPARARLLPDRFTLLGYSGGQLVLDVTGNPVPADLPVGPDPSAPDAGQISTGPGGLHVPGPLSWLVDLDAAVAVGMAFRVPLTDAVRGGLDRLVALGLRVRTPAVSTADLQTLVTHQADSRTGFRLLPQGTPTNNTGSTPSALGTVDEDAARFAALTPPAPVTAGDWAAKTDGQWLAELLGIDPAVVAAVPGADGTGPARGPGDERGALAGDLGLPAGHHAQPDPRDRRPRRDPRVLPALRQRARPAPRRPGRPAALRRPRHHRLLPPGVAGRRPPHPAPKGARHRAEGGGRGLGLPHRPGGVRRRGR